MYEKGDFRGSSFGLRKRRAVIGRPPVFIVAINGKIKIETVRCQDTISSTRNKGAKTHSSSLIQQGRSAAVAAVLSANNSILVAMIGFIGFFR
jgi:hypothetical protein